jgi:hypothetical protein
MFNSFALYLRVEHRRSVARFVYRLSTRCFPLVFNLFATGYIGVIYSQPMTTPKLKPFLMRLHPATRELLDKAAVDQRRSISSLIDQSVRDQLAPRYGGLQSRLDRFVSRVVTND